MLMIHVSKTFRIFEYHMCWNGFLQLALRTGSFTKGLMDLDAMGPGSLFGLEIDTYRCHDWLPKGITNLW